MLHADDAKIVSKPTKNHCEDDCHCDRFRISRSYRARNENGDNAATHTQCGSPGPTARCRYGEPRDIYADHAFSVSGRGLINSSADIMP